MDEKLLTLGNNLVNSQVWTAGVCEEVAEEVVQFFGNGSDSTSAVAVLQRCGVKHKA